MTPEEIEHLRHVLSYILEFEEQDYDEQCSENEEEFGVYEEHVYFHAMKLAQSMKEKGIEV